jgi:two-component system chemotaxis response regulator CheY
MATILVIDDDLGLHQLLSAMLTRQGHTVSCVPNGVEGLKALRNAPADLVLCDLFMPEKEGLETIRELHALHPGLKIIAMSGGGPHEGSLDYLRMARAFGAVDTLDKPFSMTTLCEAVEKCLLP